MNENKRLYFGNNCWIHQSKTNCSINEIHQRQKNGSIDGPPLFCGCISGTYIKYNLLLSRPNSTYIISNQGITK